MDKTEQPSESSQPKRNLPKGVITQEEFEMCRKALREAGTREWQPSDGIGRLI